MNFLINYFKKHNWSIKIGYIALAVSLLFLILGLILIGAANFKTNDPITNDPDGILTGNGFTIIYNNGLPFISQNFNNLYDLYFNLHANGYTSAPLFQIVFGSVFLIICAPIFGGVGLLALLGGYFKQWLYT